jgi:site-specific DNA-cytosine methylase
MKKITHASIIPLIGGIVIGAEQAFGKRPNYLMSYEPFAANDSHILNYYNHEVPYYVLDKKQFPVNNKVDVVISCCPCAGLSQMSHGFGDDNPNNIWMSTSTEYVLKEVKPQVLYGENAPGLSGKIGENVRNDLRRIGKENGYKMSIYRTKTLLHGGCQVRERSFFFFWKDKIPVFNYYNTPYQKIEDVIAGVTSNFQTEPINPKTPSKDDLYYKYVLEEIHGGITHREFFEQMDPQTVRNCDIQSYIERQGHDYMVVAAWMKKNGHDKEYDKCVYKYNKLKDGGSIMRRGTIVPKEYIGAFVGHFPTKLTHPYEDRYINYREAMTIMGLPDNFELLNPKKSSNHICQNVPVQTARDMAFEVIEALNGNREFIENDFVIQNNNSKSLIFERETQTLENFL